VSANDSRYVGVDVGGTWVKAALVTFAGEIERFSEALTAPAGGDSLIGQIVTLAHDLTVEAEARGKTVAGVGVVTPGAIDIRSGVVVGKCPNIPDWQGQPLGRKLSCELGMNVFIDNDARGMALGELRFGAARGAGSALCVTVGTGIGGAIIIDGKVWHGASFTAGEIGHLCVQLDGEMCKCGLKGCLETVAATPAIQRRARERIGVKPGVILSSALREAGESVETVSIATLFRAAKLGDQVCRGALDLSAAILGQALGGLANVLDPELVLVGGGVADASDSYVREIGIALRASSLPTVSSRVIVRRAALGNQAGCVGAAALAMPIDESK